MPPPVDFASQEFFRDPAGGIERLRASGPLVETIFPIIGKVWITTTYDLTARVLKDSDTFAMRKEGGRLAGLRWWMRPLVGRLANSMLTMDEPDHTRLRGIVDEAFRRRAVLDMEPRIRAIAMLESLCIPSSSVCKHWNRVVVSDATRATFSGHRRFDRFRRQVVGANLVWRAAHNLHRGQRAGFDQAAYRVACDA